MKPKKANITIKESGVRVEYTGLWSRKDVDVAYRAMLRETKMQLTKRITQKENSDD